MKHKKARIVNLNTNNITKWLLDIWGDFFIRQENVTIIRTHCNWSFLIKIVSLIVLYFKENLSNEQIY